uniref:Uncharacterized protein n=1 Tax=Ditylenchus dipsaci TaxID=166011 RepID=A0A915CWX1_9BILA
MAKLILKNNAYKIESVAEHSHEADPVDLGKRRVCKEALLIIMENRKMGPRDVYNQVNDKLSPEDSVIAAIDYANLSDLIAKPGRTLTIIHQGPGTFKMSRYQKDGILADNSLFCASY